MTNFQLDSMIIVHLRQMLSEIFQIMKKKQPNLKDWKDTHIIILFLLFSIDCMFEHDVEFAEAHGFPDKCSNLALVTDLKYAANKLLDNY